MALTTKQKRFVAAYLSCLNGSEAARRMNPDAQRPDQIAYEYLRKPEVAAAIEDGMAALAMPAPEVLARLSSQARATMDDFLDSEGNIDLVRARDRDQLHLLKSRSITKEGERIELYDAQAALALLGKHHGLFTDRLDQTGSMTIRIIEDGDG